jgi:hypothetical protein
LDAWDKENHTLANQDFWYYAIASDVSPQELDKLKIQHVKWSRVQETLSVAVNGGRPFPQLALQIYYSGRSEKINLDWYYRAHPSQIYAGYEFD